MHTLSLSFLLFFSITSMGQTYTPIEGKWKCVGMFDNEMYYNLKSDSTSFTPDLKEIQFTDAEDSASKLSEAKAMMQYIMTQFRNDTSMNNNIIFFGKDGAYQEIDNNQLGNQGTYFIDIKTNTIKLKLKRNHIVSDEEKHFSIKGKELYIKEGNDEDPFNLIYKKMD